MKMKSASIFSHIPFLVLAMGSSWLWAPESNAASDIIVASNVSIEILSPSAARITWTTNIPAASSIAYIDIAGQSKAPLATARTATYQTQHDTILNGLSPNQTYDYQIIMWDEKGGVEKREGFTFTMSSATGLLHEIYGRVTNSVDNFPVENAEVWYCASTAPEGFSACSAQLIGKTDQDGKWKLLNPNPNYYYRIWATKPFAAYSPAVTFNFTGGSKDWGVLGMMGISQTPGITVLEPNRGCVFFEKPAKQFTIEWATTLANVDHFIIGYIDNDFAFNAIAEVPANLRSYAWIPPSVPTMWARIAVVAQGSRGEFLGQDFSDAQFRISSTCFAPALQTSNIRVVNITNTTARVQWETSVPAISTVEYKIGTLFRGSGFATSVTSIPLSSHDTLLTYLVPDTTYYFYIRAWDSPQNEVRTETISFKTVSSPPPPPATPPNRAPETPAYPYGDSRVAPNTIHLYSVSAVDADGDKVKYLFDWGDGTFSESGFLLSNYGYQGSHAWQTPGIYTIRVRAQDTKGLYSAWTDPKTIVQVLQPPQVSATKPATTVEPAPQAELCRNCPQPTVAQQTPSRSDAEATRKAAWEEMQVKLQSLQAKLADLQRTTQAQEAVSGVELKLARTLQRGSSGDDVKQLQGFLKQFPDLYPEGLATGFFGPATEKAVRRFQEKNGIQPLGIVGPKTRAALSAPTSANDNCANTTTRPCFDHVTPGKTIILTTKAGEYSFQACLNSKSPSQRGFRQIKTVLSDSERYQYCFEGTSKVQVRWFMGSLTEPPIAPPAPPPPPPPPSDEAKRNGAPYDIIVNPGFMMAHIHWSTEFPTLANIEWGPDEHYGNLGDFNTVVWSRFLNFDLYPSSHGKAIQKFHFRIITTDPKTNKSFYSPDYAVITYPFPWQNDSSWTCRHVVRVPEDYRHIEVATQAACAGGTVSVGPGVYRETILAHEGVSIIAREGPTKTKIQSPASPGFGLFINSIEEYDYRNGGKFTQYVPTLQGFTISSDYVNEKAKDMEMAQVNGLTWHDGSMGVLLGGFYQSILSDGWHNDLVPYHPPSVTSVTPAPASLKLPVVKNNIFIHNDIGINTNLNWLSSKVLELTNNTFAGGAGHDYALFIDEYSLGGGNPSDVILDSNAFIGYKAGLKINCLIYCKDIDWSHIKIQYNNAWSNEINYMLEGVVAKGTQMQVSVLPKEQSEQTGKNGNISADPMFNDAAGDDYHEKSGSPHRDSGNPIFDYSLEPAPNGGRINIGVYGNTSEATKSQ